MKVLLDLLGFAMAPIILFVVIAFVAPYWPWVLAALIVGAVALFWAMLPPIPKPVDSSPLHDPDAIARDLPKPR